jgi:hypothetical protein
LSPVIPLLVQRVDLSDFVSTPVPLGRRFLPPTPLQYRISITSIDKYVRGERTAQALESNLTSLEKKIDDLLASFEESERLKVEEANSKRSSPSGEKSGGDNDEKA